MFKAKKTSLNAVSPHSCAKGVKVGCRSESGDISQSKDNEEGRRLGD